MTPRQQAIVRIETELKAIAAELKRRKEARREAHRRAYRAWTVKKRAPLGHSLRWLLQRNLAPPAPHLPRSRIGAKPPRIDPSIP